MDISSEINETLVVIESFLKVNPADEQLKKLHASLVALQKHCQEQKINGAEATSSLLQMQRDLLDYMKPFDLGKQYNVTTYPDDVIQTFIEQLYYAVTGRKEGKAGAIILEKKEESPANKLTDLLEKLIPAPGLTGEKNIDFDKLSGGNAYQPLQLFDTSIIGKLFSEDHNKSAKPPAPDPAGAEPPGEQAVHMTVEDTAQVLTSKGKILYDIPDSMKVNRQQKCVVRIAKDELTVRDEDTFTDKVKVEDIILSGVMKVELIDIAEPPNFTIKTVSSAEQAVDADTYTEWSFWVTPLHCGIYDLMLKVSVFKMVDGKERRKDIVFDKAISIAAEEKANNEKEGMVAGSPGKLNMPDEVKTNLKSLSDEKDVTVMDPPVVFISYAHKDKVYFDIFAENLRSQSGWNIWTDRNIEIGSDWFTRIQDSIKDTDFAVLLVSADFISSAFIKQNEFAEFLKLEQSKPGFTFLPVLLRDVDFTRWKDLASKQLFVAYGDEYGVPDMKGKMIPFAKLCRFDNNNQLIPNDNIDTWFKNFVIKVYKGWLIKKTQR